MRRDPEDETDGRSGESRGDEVPTSTTSGELESGAGPVAATPPRLGEPATGLNRADQPPFTHTRASGLWATVVVALLLLLALAVFILENGRHVRVSYLGAHGTLPLGIALLFAAVFGGLVVVFAGTARILQLRRRSRNQRRALSGPAVVSRRRRRHAGPS